LVTDFALEALEQTIYDRRRVGVKGLAHHTDRGNAASLDALQRLAGGDRLEPSVGSRGDSYDNALA
jgi:putative transposase